MGRLRLVTVLGELPGAIGHGFDGDGTPKGATVRIWEFAQPLTVPLSDDIKTVSSVEFDNLVTDREALKPIAPVQKERDRLEDALTPSERKALRNLLNRSN